MTLPQCCNPRCEHDHTLISWMDVYCCMPCRVAHHIGTAAGIGDTDDSATDIGDYVTARQAITDATSTAQQAGEHLATVVVLARLEPEVELEWEDIAPDAPLVPESAWRLVDPPPRPGYLFRVLRRLFG